MSATDEAVERAARAIWEVCWLGDWEDAEQFQRAACRDEAGTALVAALPVIERDLRETIAKEIASLGLPLEIAARIREGA